MEITNAGYVQYLETRLALAEETLRKQGSFVMPEDPLIRRLNTLDVGTVISWCHRFPRGDVYKYIAFLQKSNEWHMVSGKVKKIFTHAELAGFYVRYGLDDFKVLS
jgi:hypothetical protein